MACGGSAEHSLLFGLLALHAGLVDGDALVAVISQWTTDPSNPLAEVLIERGLLDAEDRDAVEALVARTLARNDNDTSRSLAALARDGTARDVLTRVSGIQPVLTRVETSRSTRWAAGPDAGRANPGPAAPGGVRYRILRPHARGGLGEVFVARDEELNREVALKEIQLNRADNAVYRNRFLLEAEITARLEHPGIVPVYGLGTYADGRPFYAMRFIEGDDLRAAVERFHAADGPRRDPGERWLAFRELLGRFVAVCNAVAFAHSKGVLHRDLKPGNVMLGKYGETLLVDWGVAKPLGQPDDPNGDAAMLPRTVGVAATLAGTAVGTPAYMSPEQAAGHLDRVGTASDVYGLGATLYTLLTGRPPVEEREMKAALDRVIRGDVAPPRRVKPETPAALDAICRKAMAPRPEDRYASALALASDVEHWLADEPVAAYREDRAERAARWLKRHRQWVLGAAAVMLAVVPLALVIAVNREQARREIGRQKEIAEANEQTATDREAESRAVLDFVESKVFAAARPTGQDGGLGRDVTLRTAVEAALPFVATGFTTQPLIQARLRRSLGTSFLYLGEAGVATEQFEIARKLYTEHLGPDHRDTLASMHGLAEGYYALGRHADALKLYEETLALRKATLGPDHPDTLTTMAGMAAAEYALGRYADALALREETLARRKAVLGPDHPDTLASMHNLANSYGSVGRQPDALRLAEETLVLMKARLGPEHPRTLWSMHFLANCYDGANRHADALPLHQESLRLRKARLGADHPDTLTGMSDLAICYRGLGRPADSLKLNEEVLAIRKAKLGPDHMSTLISMNNLASNYDEVGRHADALKLNEETLTRMKAKLGPDHPYTLQSMGCVAESLVNLDRGAEALPIIDDVVRRSAGKASGSSLVADVMALRGRHFAKVKDAAAGRATAAMWEAMNRTDADSLYAAACFRALTAGTIRARATTESAAAEADVEAGKAVAWLRQAVAAGYKDAAALKSDKDLDALRNRDDFKGIVAEVEAKDRPK
jgi:eukaryotic-like serine/threonine-protein kinase